MAAVVNPELEQDQRRAHEADQHVAPGRQEADRAHAVRGVGGQKAGGRRQTRPTPAGNGCRAAASGGRIGSCSRICPCPANSPAGAHSMTCGNGWPGYRPAILRHPVTGMCRVSPPKRMPPRAGTLPPGSPEPMPLRAGTSRPSPPRLANRTGPERMVTRAGRTWAARTRAAGWPLIGRAGAGGRAAPPLGTCLPMAVTARTGHGSPASRPGRGSAMTPLAVRAERGLAGLLAGE